MSQPFVRDRFTWVTYGMLAYFAFVQSSLGQIMPFLRDELQLSYMLGGLHISATALGTISAGLVADRIAARLGRRYTFWGGALGMAVGALLLVVSPSVWLTLPSAFLIGGIGSLLLTMIQASLADHHGPQRAIAFTESNVIASIGSMLVPLLIGAFQTSGAGWRITLVFPVVVVAIVAWIFGRNPIPEQRAQIHQTAGRSLLPLAFWCYLIVVVLCVAIEWCMLVWGADMLEHVVGLSKSMAATSMTFFFVAQIAGRFLGSRLTRSISSEKLLLGALAITLAGFPLFWLSSSAPLNIIGLTILGFGVANLFPMTLSVATSVAADQANSASARIVMSSGIAIFTAPLLMGWVADQLGIMRAFGIVALLILLATIVTIATERLARRRVVVLAECAHATGI